ncbi:hypothetical protein diail_11119, partial [Diaporthe ilicicola]
LLLLLNPCPFAHADPSRSNASTRKPNSPALVPPSRPMDSLSKRPSQQPLCCQNCRREMVKDNIKQLADHAATHSNMTKEQCWPGIVFP